MKMLVKSKRVSIRSRIPVTLLCAFILLTVLATAGTAAAQSSDNQRTLFVIGNINAAVTYPLRAYNIVGTDLVLAHTWYPINRDDGPVGLAIDPVNQHLFVSYENLDAQPGILDVFDATDATPLGQITLVGTDDLAGIDVNEDRGQLVVIDRCQPNVYTFDSETFDPVGSSWAMSSVYCPFGIDVIDEENLLFVADATNTVRWYDLDTHAQVGSATLTFPAAGIAVDYSPGYPVIYTTCLISGSPESPPADVPYLVKYDTNTSTQSLYSLGAAASGRGIGLDVNSRIAYVAAGSGLASSLRIVDMDTLQEYGRINFPAFPIPWSPTDVETTWLAFGSNVKKTSPTHPDGEINAGQQVTFEITVENRNSRPIHILPLKDEFNVAHLTYVSSNPPADNIDTVNGIVEWNDLIPTIGHDLEFEETYTVSVTFQATPTACETWVDGTNLGIMTGAEDDRGTVLDDSSGSMAYRIWCTCETDEDCDDGIWCDGTEQCIDRECVSSGNPCPQDDGVYCNGEETIVCLEETQECGHSGDPCADDGNLCNGTESCDEEAAECTHSGDPCTDDGDYCNGDEFCDPTQIECQHTGDPCPEGEICVEESDECKTPEDDTPLDDAGEKDPQAGWPEGQVTGGCCGCGNDGGN